MQGYLFSRALPAAAVERLFPKRAHAAASGKPATAA
jgi:EAL domain-containing protein (putative c-di-GMP-specific phosphodiesterase class I)